MSTSPSCIGGQAKLANPIELPWNVNISWAELDEEADEGDSSAGPSFPPHPWIRGPLNSHPTSPPQLALAGHQDLPAGGQSTSWADLVEEEMDDSESEPSPELYPEQWQLPQLPETGFEQLAHEGGPVKLPWGPHLYGGEGHVNINDEKEDRRRLFWRRMPLPQLVHPSPLRQMELAPPYDGPFLAPWRLYMAEKRDYSLPIINDGDQQTRVLHLPRERPRYGHVSESPLRDVENAAELPELAQDDVEDPSSSWEEDSGSDNVVVWDDSDNDDEEDHRSPPPSRPSTPLPFLFPPSPPPSPERASPPSLEAIPFWALPPPSLLSPPPSPTAPSISSPPSSSPSSSSSYLPPATAPSSKPAVIRVWSRLAKSIRAAFKALIPITLSRRRSSPPLLPL